MAMFKNIILPIETAYCAGILGTASMDVKANCWKKAIIGRIESVSTTMGPPPGKGVNEAIDKSDPTAKPKVDKWAALETVPDAVYCKMSRDTPSPFQFPEMSLVEYGYVPTAHTLFVFAQHLTYTLPTEASYKTSFAQQFVTFKACKRFPGVNRTFSPKSTRKPTYVCVEKPRFGLVIFGVGGRISYVILRPSPCVVEGRPRLSTNFSQSKFTILEPSSHVNSTSNLCKPVEYVIAGSSTTRTGVPTSHPSAIINEELSEFSGPKDASNLFKVTRTTATPGFPLPSKMLQARSVSRTI